MKTSKPNEKTETVRIDIPNGVDAELSGNNVKVKGTRGVLEKRLAHQNISIAKEGNKVILTAKKASKREKRLMNTFKAHLKNAILGIQDGFVYKLKICYSHFPINVTVSGNEIIIKNFLGEKTPRKSKILDGVKVEVKGDEVIASGIDIEKVSQTAANLESATRITNRDRRVFLDGIYITNKAGVSLA
ncbi:50S ribosomal protein L6 [Candidatus Woesearchaeota archaeon]|nr:50S ribosomal protein L6 [Candidatus Woesearchaeota archaeon]